jgi:hypothetical protein
MERNCKTVLLPSVNSCNPGRKCHAVYSGLNGVDARYVATTGGRRLFWIVITVSRCLHIGTLFSYAHVRHDDTHEMLS